MAEPAARGAEQAPKSEPKAAPKPVRTAPNGLPPYAMGQTVEEAGDDFAALFGGEGEGDGGKPGKAPEPEPEPDADNAHVEGDEAEPEAEEAPAEGEEGEEPAEGDGEAEPPNLETLTYPVTINGEVKEVPIAELAKSYAQESAYTQKSQTLAEERRAFEERRTQWASETQALAARFDEIVPVLVQQYRATQRSAEEMERLRVEDPGAWSATMHDRKQQLEAIRQAQAQREAIAQHEAAEQERALQASIPGEVRSLMEKNPRFRTKGGTFNHEHYEKLGKFLLGQGIRPEEWGRLYDHRYLHLAEMAMQYEEAARHVAKAQPQLAKLAKPVRPGAQQPKRKLTPRETEVRAIRAKERALAETGSVTAAGELFSHLFQ